MKNWDIDKIVSAVIADDPEAEVIRGSLTQALEEVKTGKYGRKTEAVVSPVAQLRHKLGVSQNEFSK